MKPGPRNLITDVDGILVGNAQDAMLKSGTTVLTADRPFTASVHVMGGAPGTRETDLLAPDRLVSDVDALVLSGGSALGLEAASAVANTLRARGRGFDVDGQKVPIVPAAILFDLLNGGDKDWQLEDHASPYARLGVEALSACGTNFEIGSVGAGTGATTCWLKGGLGSASAILENGITIGALVAVNAFGCVAPQHAAHFWAAPWEFIDADGGEFGGLGPVTSSVADHGVTLKGRFDPRQNTTIGIIATDADLTKTECARLALAAHDGYARAIVPSHTDFDGDLIFAASTRGKQLNNRPVDTSLLGHAAACVMARAIARAVWNATPTAGDINPCMRQRVAS